jgi:hypothetical protein
MWFSITAYIGFAGASSEDLQFQRRVGVVCLSMWSSIQCTCKSIGHFAGLLLAQPLRERLAAALRI